MDTFCIIANKFKDVDNLVTNQVATFLRTNGKTVHIKENNGNPVPKDTECIIVLGGDGTMLEAARDNREVKIPLMGINLGNVGYLATVEKTNIPGALKQLLEGNYKIEKRMLLVGTRICKKGKLEEIHALNDIVIARGSSLHIISFSIFVNGQYLNTYSADGVIISTPTGSTGYNLSAGGPIVEPNARLILITLICPHTLNTRSIIFSAQDKITIRINEASNQKTQTAEVSFDGQESILLEAGDEIDITESKLTAQIMKMDDLSFLATLHKKISD